MNKMDYETFIKLKVAGYPIKDFGYAPDVWKGGGISPTLSELIEACEHFRLLEKEIGYWRACGWKIDLKDSIEEHGSTPEIAVANLWLELNKK